jgi:uncharacterized protein (TIGR03083 family)
MSDGVRQMMEQAWSSMEEVASSLTPEEWDLPTDCPGWTVRDQVAHVAAVESVLLGADRAPSGPIQAPYVRNDLGARNEAEIRHRRDRPAGVLLDEYRESTAGRAKLLTDLSAEDWEADATGPLGNAALKDVIGIRILDVFYHEQDVRVATGKPGHLHGDVARFVFERMAAAMPFVVGKRAAAADGQTVLFEIGPPGETFAIGMSGGRGGPVQPVPHAPTVKLSMDGETFLRLAGGRWMPKRAEEEGRLRVEGDHDLADRVLSNMAVTP